MQAGRLTDTGKTVALSLVLINSYGALVEAYCLLDMSQPVVYRAKVVDKS